LVAKAGDVRVIPQRSRSEIGTPSTVRFLYVAWPANWQTLCTISLPKRGSERTIRSAKAVKSIFLPMLA
ncbi:hypothetical protein GEP08_23010, partial [Salmonella enterica subsp. enterica serovar Anatum]|nr:hypothetical protein [Salmonella enterica subsp. enterica serovar Anatum]